MKAFALLAFVIALAVGALVVTNGSVEACCVWGSPPTITGVTANPSSLWPPNHKMGEVCIAITGASTDPATWSVTAVGVTDSAGGAGDPSNDPDFAGVPGGPVVFPAQPICIQLRAERSGEGTGRNYQVQVAATNRWGTSTSAVNVVVPHNQTPK